MAASLQIYDTTLTNIVPDFTIIGDYLSEQLIMLEAQMVPTTFHGLVDQVLVK